MFKVNNKRSKTTSLTLFIDIDVISHFFSSFSIVHFEQVNVCNVSCLLLLMIFKMLRLIKDFNCTSGKLLLRPVIIGTLLKKKLSLNIGSLLTLSLLKVSGISVKHFYEMIRYKFYIVYKKRHVIEYR